MLLFPIDQSFMKLVQRVQHCLSPQPPITLHLPRLSWPKNPEGLRFKLLPTPMTNKDGHLRWKLREKNQGESKQTLFVKHEPSIYFNWMVVVVAGMFYNFGGLRKRLYKYYSNSKDIFLNLESISTGLEGSHKEHLNVLNLKAAEVIEGQV